nr:serine hydrolase domain-containing protein [Allomuricauda sp.]
MKYLTPVFVLFFSIAVTGQALNLTKVIDSIIAEVDPNGPGVAIGILKEGTLISSKCKGMSNLDYNIPIDASTNFRLSSSSKQFTAACIILLIEKGQLRMEDPLSKFFPEFSKDLGNVTVAQLLNHTSGIRDYMSLLTLKGSHTMDFFNNFIGTDEDLLALIQKQNSLSFKSGSQHDYSNTNYWILGQLVQRITEKSLGTYAKENLFEPLGMKNTFFIENTGRVIPKRASGYISECPDCERMEYSYQSTAVGDGGVVSNINDLTKWENEFHDPKVFSIAFWNLMLRKGELNNGKKIEYASGLIIGELEGQEMISHSGQNPGFSSDLVRFPDSNLSIVALANQNWYDIRSYAFSAAKAILNLENPKSKSPAKKEPITLSTEELSRFCEDYHFLETNEYRSIQLQDEQLFYVRTNGPSSKLIPLSNSTLTFEDRPNVILHFNFESRDKKSILLKDGTIRMNANSYKKTVVKTEELMEYSSMYVNEELEKRIALEIIDKKLVFPIFGQKFPVEPLTKDTFLAMGMFTLKFKRNDKGNIVGFHLDAPRAKNIEFKKTN